MEYAIAGAVLCWTAIVMLVVGVVDHLRVNR